MPFSSVEILSLLQKQAGLEQQLAEAKERETRLVIIEMVAKMREYQISLNELMGRDGGPIASHRVIYRDPVSGATWAGRGRAPQWILGKNREDFRILR